MKDRTDEILVVSRSCALLALTDAAIGGKKFAQGRSEWLSREQVQCMPRKPIVTPAPKPPKSDVLIRADNGDVITFDETGLTLRLSDAVIADLKFRLGLEGQAALDAADHLGDVDAWALHQVGRWLRFTARLEAGREPREYMKSAGGGDIIAAASGPIYGIFSLGGARRAGFNAGPVKFRYHILASGDDIGAVGLEGTAEAARNDRLQHLRHASRDALIAQTLLSWRYDALKALPLFVCRCESDNTYDITELTAGRGYRNFLIALDNLNTAAASLNKRAEVLAVSLDFGLEDQTNSAAELANGLRALMAQIERDMAQRNLHRPIFLMTAEAGTRQITTHPAIQANWELAWLNSGHRLAISAPGYMFEQTEFGRPTQVARVRMAEMDAHAIIALSNRQTWLCPLPVLAEAADSLVRVTFQSSCDLVLDDTLGAGPTAGFAVEDAHGSIPIMDVEIAQDDPRSLLLTCKRAPSHVGAQLRYASGAIVPSEDAFPANRGGLRDTWSSPSQASEVPLHRWALPACLPIHPANT